MAYPDGLEGKYVRFRLPTPNNPGADGLVENQFDGPTVAQTLSVFDTLDDAYKQDSQNPPWTFTFLIYIPGTVTTTALTQDVMTGPMSGCYLFKYTRQGARIAHVGTESSPSTSASVAAKTAWKALIARNDVTAITGADPFRNWRNTKSAGKRTEPGHDLGPPVIYGYFTSGGTRTYAIELALVSRRYKPGKSLKDSQALSGPVVVAAAPPMKIMSVVRMGMLPWMNVSRQPAFL